MGMYVIKHGDCYLQFGSYNTATTTDRPWEGTLYSLERHAVSRLRRCRRDGVYMKRPGQRKTGHVEGGFAMYWLEFAMPTETEQNVGP